MSNSQGIDLPKHQRGIYDDLKGKGDVSIVLLYERFRERAGKPVTTDDLRLAHQYLGPFVTKMNRRLERHGLAVRPGDLKGTLRLCVL